MKTNILLGGMTAVVALTVGFAAQAATTPLYSGGGTLAEKVYRDIFNAYGNTAGGDLAIGVNTPPATPYNATVEALYVGVGSGNGKAAYTHYDASQYTTGARTPDAVPVPSTRDFGPFFGTGAGATWVPGLSPAFPKVSFSGSDDPLTTADLTTYAAQFGPAVQFPALVTGVTVPFTPATGTWTPNGGTPSGYSSRVQFSTNTLCGIFTGAITTWNDAAITADNGKKVLGTGTITVVYRNDSSGTTFLFSNALLNQCGTTSHPVSTHPVPDQWLTDNAIANTAPFTSQNKFFINVFSAGHLPANFSNNAVFAGVTGGAKGSSGVQKAVDATPGSVGYVSPDFAKPIATGNDSNGKPVPAAVNLQTYYSFINHLTAKYVAPTPTTAAAIMSTFAAPSFTIPTPAGLKSAFDPLSWGAVNPTPTSTGAYPIGGFTFIDLYSCYGTAATATAPLVGTTAGTLGLFRWYFGSTTEQGGTPVVANLLKQDGFSALPGSWLGAVKTLLFSNTTTKIGYAKQAKTACAAVAKGA